MIQAAKPIPVLTDENKRNFHKKISTTPTETGCLEWLAWKLPTGYGQFGIKGKLFSSHRIAYFLATGVDPYELCVCHTCDNPSCVNFLHLFLGTPKENVQDREKKGRNKPPYGNAHGMAKLKESDIPLIRSDPRKYRIIAVDYGVNPCQIGRIKRGQIWKHVA